MGQLTAVYVPMTVSLPAVLLAATRVGARLRVNDVSNVDGARVIYVDSDVAIALSSDERLSFVPPLPQPEPEPQPQAVAVPEPRQTTRAAVTPPSEVVVVDEPATETARDKPAHTAEPDTKPTKKRAAKKTNKKTTATKRSKTRGAHGGES